MNASTGNLYYLTERYQRKMYKDIILNELITFIFYFVFNILFKDHPNYGILKHVITFIFIMIAIALLFFGKKRADRIGSIHYELKKNGLKYFNGRKTIFYPWEDFTEIKRNPNKISLIFPYEFHTKEEVFSLHRQIDNPDQLIGEIAKRTGLEWCQTPPGV